MYSLSIGRLSCFAFCASYQVFQSKLHAGQIDDNDESPQNFRRVSSSHNTGSNNPDANAKPKPCVGIIGGGITGISVAHALTQHGADANITVLEGDMPPKPSVVDFASDHKPTWEAALAWEAATARNGNSIVPGACYHGLATKAELWKVFSDTAREWYDNQLDSFQGMLPKSAQEKRKRTDTTATIGRLDSFDVVPPYFALHLWHCLGPDATSDERRSFFRFVYRYLTTVFFQANEEHDRGLHILQLAKATRTMYLNHVDQNKALQICIGHSQGFLALYRSKEAAEAAVKENAALGEESYLVDWTEAVQLEPQLRHIPIRQALFVVRRPNDYTANCNAFVRHLIEESKEKRVKHVSTHVNKVQRLPGNRFLVTSKDGMTWEFDVLVLSAGIETPLLAAQLGIGHLCPTYPLRGFSLTIFGWKHQTEYSSNEQQQNLLRQPFKLDAMYCSSVAPWMARWVGFGEFTGYRRQSDGVTSIGPSILARYAKAIFPDAEDAEVKKALVGFRPMSPDDMPIVGEATSVPGLFFNTGHGSLGWTTGLASGDICAQQIASKLKGNRDTTFQLADGTWLRGDTFSPNRFA